MANHEFSLRPLYDEVGKYVGDLRAGGDNPEALKIAAMLEGIQHILRSCCPPPPPPWPGNGSGTFVCHIPGPHQNPRPGDE